MEKRQIVWLFILLTFCTGYIFSFTLLGEQAFERVFAQNEGFAEGTTIGSVNVSHLSNQEVLDKLQTECRNWANETTINLQYREKSIEFSDDSFVFLLEKSINLAKTGEQNPFILELKDDSIHSILAGFSLSEEKFNSEAFMQEVLSYPSMLTRGIHMIKLDDFMLEGPENQLISEASVSDIENSEQMDLWVGQFPSITIAPNSQFSLLDVVEESGVRTSTAEGLSIVATSIYQAILPTNFQVTERSTSRVLPAYVKAGYEAKVNMKQNMDLVISNVTDYEYTLEFKYANNTLSVSLTGPAFLYEYKVVERNLETFKPKNILQFDAKLEPNQQVVRKNGQDGRLIQIYREIFDQNGALLNRELLSEDFYPPVHTIVATGFKADVEEQEEIEADTGTETEDPAGEEQGADETSDTVPEKTAKPPASTTPTNVAPGIAPGPTPVIPPAGYTPPASNQTTVDKATK